MAELVNDGMNGFLFNPGDAKDLQEKIECIADKQEVISRISDNMPAVSSIEGNAKEIEEIYCNLFDRPAE